MESPSSQPSQSAKIPKVSRPPPMQKTVKQNGKPHYNYHGIIITISFINKARKKLFADAEDYTGVKVCMGL